MKHLKYLAFLAFAAAVCSAAPVTFSSVSVTCKEISHNAFTSNLTITVDGAVNGGTISAGAAASDNCFFTLAGNLVVPPFTNTTYNYSNGVTPALDTVCWQAVGFCNNGTTPATLVISTVAAGKLFTITSSSIVTTFTLPTAAATPEPGSMALMGSALAGLAVFARSRKSRRTSAASVGSES